MATSTEVTVRNVIIAALKAVATTDLGFDDPNGNIKDYILEYHHPETPEDFLMADVGGERIARAWAVDVEGADTVHSLNNQWKRTYHIRIVGYYGLGQNGDGRRALIDGSRRVRLAIKSLYANLSYTVTMVTKVSESKTELKLSPIQEGPGAGAMLIKTFVLEAERIEPDY